MGLPANVLSIGNLYPEVKLGDLTLPDLWEFKNISSEYASKKQLFITYQVHEGERWYQLADRLYNDRELWWVIALFNDVDDPFKIYYDNRISSSITTVKVLDSNFLPELLNKIRKQRVASLK